MKKMSLSCVIAMVIRLHRNMGEHTELQSGTEAEEGDKERKCMNVHLAFGSADTALGAM